MWRNIEYTIYLIFRCGIFLRALIVSDIGSTKLDSVIACRMNLGRQFANSRDLRRRNQGFVPFGTLCNTDLSLQSILSVIIFIHT